MSSDSERGDSVLLKMEGVFKSYETIAERVAVLQGIDLEILSGELICIFGASGSGKSTLLNIASSVDVPDSGAVSFRGLDISTLTDAGRAEFRLNEMGIVFQDGNLVPDFTAAENVELVLRARGMSGEKSRKECERVFKKLNIAELSGRYPREMSGGQAQRVGIARAVAGGHRLIVADEPTGALDNKNSRSLFQLLQQLTKSFDTAVLMGTHDRLAASFADRTFSMIDGKLVQR